MAERFPVEYFLERCSKRVQMCSPLGLFIVLILFTRFLCLQNVYYVLFASIFYSKIGLFLLHPSVDLSLCILHLLERIFSLFLEGLILFVLLWYFFESSLFLPISLDYFFQLSCLFGVCLFRIFFILLGYCTFYVPCRSFF